jgi:DNA-binding NarL/FixJ family response regulator
MDQPLLLLAGVGVLVVIASLWMPRFSGRANAPQTLQWDAAEVEKSIQRFVQQVKAEQQQAISRALSLHAEGQAEARELEKRVQALEEKVHQLQMELQQVRERVADSGGTPFVPQLEPDALLLKERYRRIFELKEEGLTIDDIAKRLGAGRGEIELIFSLASTSTGREVSHE